MLSIGNPPPDLPCPCEISQLLKSGSHDNPSDSEHHHLQQQEQLDLSNSGPKFSIRDYVSSSRSKDIKTNWPFSQKNLQLCLKHGVRNLLPPFQSLDAVRSPYANRCAAENESFDEKNAGNLKLVPSSRNCFPASSTSSDAGRMLDSVNINASGSEEERGFPLTSAEQSCSDTCLFPSRKSYCLESKADPLPEYTATKLEKKVPLASHKVENKGKAQVKKCKLIVKLSNTTNQSSKEDSRTSNFSVSETMASKVCPVCKTFTSSSNTTLNAHIDQCLSGESSIKWSANPKVIKNKIKPRRMRSMVDIYATSLCCTLEDLDRRNGTNWASGLSLPAQELEVCASESKWISPDRFEGTENEGAVYVDANGTKLRILSKFDDLPSTVKVGAHTGPEKLMKGHKGNKPFLMKKKKKKHVNKLHKLQEFAPDGQKLCASRHQDDSEINNVQVLNTSPEEIQEKEKALTQYRKSHDQVKLHESGMMSGWVCSKRTGLKKRVKYKYNDQHSAYGKEKESGPKELSLETSHLKRGYDLRSPTCSKNPLSSPKTSMNSSREPHDDGNDLLVRKRARVSLLESETHDNHNGSHLLSEGKRKQLREDASVKYAIKNHLNYKANSIRSLSCRRDEKKRSLATNADNYVASSKKTSSHHPFSSKTKRLSLRKTRASDSQAFVPQCKFSSQRKLLTHNKPRVHCSSESDEEGSETRDKMNASGTRVSKARKDGGKINISRKEELMILKGSISAPEYHEHDDDDNFDSSYGNVFSGRFDSKESSENVVYIHGEGSFVDPTFYMPTEEASGGITNSSDARRDVTSRSDVQSDSRRFVKIYNEHLLGTRDSRYPVETMLSRGQEIFGIDGDGKSVDDQNVHMTTELDSNDGPGNYYADVDPIPIPGPPGSFLPSPGRMTSEEFQGTSSLTSSRIHSSEDHPEFGDREFSDSPSATSTISNPEVTKFDSRVLEKLQLVNQSGQDDIRPCVSGANVDALANNLIPSSCTAYAGAQRLDPVEPKANVMFPEIGFFNTNNEHPCCCSRKEGALLGASSSSHQESSSPLYRQCMPADVDPSRLKNCNSKSEVVSSGDVGGGTQDTTRYPLGQIPRRDSSDSKVKSSIVCDGESPSPSSNPVLRLMGKDLMVINNDENCMPQLRPSSIMNSLGNPLPYTSSGVYSDDCLKRDPRSCHLMESRDHNNLVQTRGSLVTHHSNVLLSNCYKKANYGAPHVLPSSIIPEGCSATSESLDHMCGYYSSLEQLREGSRLLICDMEKAGTSVQGNSKGASGQKSEEIIVINDAPGSTADFGLCGISGAVTSGNQIHSDHFYGYPPLASSPLRGTPSVQTATFRQMPSPGGVSSSPLRWNCIPEGSNLLPRPGSFPNSSSHAYHHMRSTVYNPHGFS